MNVHSKHKPNASPNQLPLISFFNDTKPFNVKFTASFNLSESLIFFLNDIDVLTSVTSLTALFIELFDLNFYYRYQNHDYLSLKACIKNNFGLFINCGQFSFVKQFKKVPIFNLVESVPITTRLSSPCVEINVSCFS